MAVGLTGGILDDLLQALFEEGLDALLEGLRVQNGCDLRQS